MTDKTYNVLFLCTGNSPRSILAEAVMDKLGAGRFKAWSAGSQPKGEVHPMALSVLENMGFDTSGMRSKSWNEFSGSDAPEFDFIFTVCDNAAGETCPVWPGKPITAHWGIEDPATVEGEGQRAAFMALMQALRKICDKRGIVLVADEVQTGFARTGKLFAMEHYDVRPDIITMAKSLAGGFPLSAVTGRADLMDAVEPGGLGGTYGGSPVGCAAALAVLDIIDDEALCARSERLGQRVMAKLSAIANRNDVAPVDAVRGVGSMIAFDIVTERGCGIPDGARAKRVTSAALENGLLLLSCGVSGETIRLLYPLTIEDEVLVEGLRRLESALATP